MKKTYREFVDSINEAKMVRVAPVKEKPTVRDHQDVKNYKVGDMVNTLQPDNHTWLPGTIKRFGQTMVHVKHIDGSEAAYRPEHIGIRHDAGPKRGQKAFGESFTNYIKQKFTKKKEPEYHDLTDEHRKLIRSNFKHSNVDTTYSPGKYVLPKNAHANHGSLHISFRNENGQLKASVAHHHDSSGPGNPKEIPVAHTDHDIHSVEDINHIKSLSKSKRVFGESKEDLEWKRAILRKHGSVKPGHWNGKKFVTDLSNADSIGFDHERLKAMNAHVECGGKVVAGRLRADND